MNNDTLAGQFAGSGRRMIHKLWRQLIYRYFSATCASLIALVALITIGVSLMTMVSFSRQEANRLLDRYVSESKGPLLVQEYQWLSKIGEAFVEDSRVDSVQTYRREKEHLVPMHGEVSRAAHEVTSITPALSWASALLSPLFQHHLNESIRINRRELGRAEMVVNDWIRNEVAVKLIGTLLCLFSLLGVGVYWVSQAGHHYVQRLLRDTYRESGSAHLRSMHNLRETQRYPILSRIHQNIRKLKRSCLDLREENAHLRHQVKQYQDILNQEHLNNDAAEIVDAQHNRRSDTALLNYSITLIQHLLMEEKSPSHKEALTQLHHGLVGLSRDISLQKKGVSREGHFDFIQLASMLHVMACHHHTHQVTFYPCVSLQQHYQGHLPDVMHIATRMLQDAMAISQPKSHLTMTLDTQSITRHLKISVLVSTPSSRSAHREEASGHLSQRRIFSDLYDDMTSIGVSLHIDFQHADGIVLTVSLPLRPAIKPKNAPSPLPLDPAKLYLIDDGTKTSHAISQLYQQLGVSVSSVTPHDTALLEDDHVPVILPISHHSSIDHFPSFGRISNPVIAIGLSRAMQSVKEKAPSWIKGVVNLESSPLLHLQQFSVISNTRNVASLTRSPLSSVEASTTLAELLNQHEAKPSIDNTVWIPADLPPLGTASLRHALNESSFEMKSYTDEADVLIQGSEGDMMFVRCDHFTRFSPSSDLTSLETLSAAGISVIALSQSGIDEPSISMLKTVDQVVSLPADPGYLSSVIAARCGV